MNVRELRNALFQIEDQELEVVIENVPGNLEEIQDLKVGTVPYPVNNAVVIVLEFDTHGPF